MGEKLATGNRLPDRVAASLRAAVSAIPFAGGALSEIISEVIPNQRMDRIERFLIFLSEEMEAMRATNQYPRSEGPQLELLETGLRSAAATSATEKQNTWPSVLRKGLPSLTVRPFGLRELLESFQNSIPRKSSSFCRTRNRQFPNRKNSINDTRRYSTFPRF